MASAKATIVAMKLRILEIHYDSAYLREMSQACLPKKRSASHLSLHSAAAPLTYSPEACEHAAQVSACFENEEALVNPPMLLVGSWANTNQVGIDYIQPTDKGPGLRIVIEMDFHSLQPRPEDDDSGNVLNPEQTAVC